jgi:hypothetical protein
LWPLLLSLIFVSGVAAAADSPSSSRGTPSATPEGSAAAGEASAPRTEAAEPATDAPRAATERGTGAATPGSGDWAARVERLARGLDAGTASREKADELYRAISDALWEKQDEVYAALLERSPDALDRREGLVEMYRARVRLLDLVSPRMHARLLGAGPKGIRELRLELAVARLDVLFQTLAIPRGLRSIVEAFVEDPLDFLGRFIELIFGIVVFRVWRRWARRGIPEARREVLAVRPRTEVHLQLARLLWYVQRFRSPLEWLALLYFVSTVLEFGDLEEVATLVGVILLWTLLTRFGLLLVDALAAGAEDGGEARVAALRLRSLRLVAAWVLLTGLGLDLISRYVAEAAIHAWASRLSTLLLVPLGILLVFWWREEIHRRVKHAASYSAVASRIGQQEKGLAGYLNAIVGALYLLGAKLLQLLVRVASRFEAGRKLVATLLRREVEREAQGTDQSEHPLSEEQVLDLLTPDDSVIAGPYQEGLERLKEYAAAGHGGTIAVLAERGGGLGTFLDLAREEIGESMRVIDCPLDGIEKLRAVMAEEFGLPEDAELEAELRPRVEDAGVRVIAVHNLHRIVRPARGGLAGLDQLARILGSLGEDVFCIVTFTRTSWSYVSRMLGDRAILQDVIELPPWSEAQLEELCDVRCRKAGIDPDYRRLSFPRQFDDGERKTLAERNRLGYRRVLWELSDGNPEVAIRLFTDSLRETPNGRVVVRLPQPASSTQIASSNLTTMLVLKVLMETEFATLEDLHACTRERIEVLSNVLAGCLQSGWVEQVYDHYQITWSAYRRVKSVLLRRGLLAR